MVNLEAARAFVLFIIKHISLTVYILSIIHKSRSTDQRYIYSAASVTTRQCGGDSSLLLRPSEFFSTFIF